MRYYIFTSITPFLQPNINIGEVANEVFYIYFMIFIETRYIHSPIQMLVFILTGGTFRI